MIKVKGALGHSTETRIAAGIADFERTTVHLPVEDKEAIWNTLERHKLLWQVSRPGAAVKSTGHIRVIGPPVKQKLRFLTDPMKEVLEKALTEMLSTGIIRPSHSPWASCPVFTQRKGTKDLRLCLDFRPSQPTNRRGGLPLPLLWDRVLGAAHHRWYICLDLDTAFWNIPFDANRRKLLR